MFQLFKVIRVSIYVGTLFLFQNCSSQLPSIWVLRDVQSLDAKVMSTVQWLKIEKSNVKFLDKAIKKKMGVYRKTNFPVYLALEKEIEKINKSLKNIETNLSKQKKIAGQIRRRPKMKIFDNASLNESKTKLFSKKNIGISRSGKSERAIKIINALEKNSAGIIFNQQLYNNSVEQLIKIFKKEGYSLIFIREEVKEFAQELKGLMYERSKLDSQLDRLNLKISESLLASEESSYSKTILNLSQKIEGYSEQMNEFENYVNNLESIAGKECKGLVYVTKNDIKKKYQNKYHNDFLNYKFILKEIPKIVSSI
ncbi:MAG: hypothetical protein VXA17_02165 [bacterium]|jgi:prefoldin subunit 5